MIKTDLQYYLEPVVLGLTIHKLADK